MTRQHPLRRRRLSWHSLPENVRAYGPWTAILFITAGFQFFRGAPVDGGIFVALAVILLVEATGLLSFAEIIAFRPRRSVLIAGAVIAGLLLVITPRHGIIDGLVLIAVGLTMFPMVWPNPGGDAGAHDEYTRFSSRMRRAAILWACIAVFGCLLEVTSFLFGLKGPHAVEEHPAVSNLVNPILDPMPGRALFVLVWILIGLALLNRGRK